MRPFTLSCYHQYATVPRRVVTSWDSVRLNLPMFMTTVKDAKLIIVNVLLG
jgi:hypothetical protein